MLFKLAIFASFFAMAMAVSLTNKHSSTFIKRGPPNGLDGFQSQCTKQNCVSITFDDGPWIYMRDIVDTADRYGIKVTFFINANNYDCIYNKDRVADLRYAFERGHQFCSHTTSHPDLNTLSHEQIKTQMKDLNDALWKVLGVRTNCMRPPYGNANQDVLDYLNNELGYVVFYWNYDTQDSDGATLESSKQLMNGIHPGDQPIILMHEPDESTAHDLFPYTIKKLFENGFEKEDFYTAPASIGFDGYRKIGGYEERDESWSCNEMPQPGPN